MHIGDDGREYIFLPTPGGGMRRKLLENATREDLLLIVRLSSVHINAGGSNEKYDQLVSGYLDNKPL